MKWNSEGCFNEHKKQTKKALGFKFATIKGINTENPDIEKVFRMCKVAAEQDGYKIFAIPVRKNNYFFHDFFLFFILAYLYNMRSFVV